MNAPALISHRSLDELEADLIALSTHINNTIMPCSKHHQLLHEGGFEIKLDANGEWHFRNASGMKTSALS